MDHKKTDKLSGERSTSIGRFVSQRSWEHDNWEWELLEVLFKIRERDSTITAEIYGGFVQFIACMYFLPVIPQKLEAAGYDTDNTFVVAALVSALGCILTGLIANLPFIVAPPTAISIFVSVALQQTGMDRREGNVAVILSGLFLILFGWRPLGDFVTKLIPSSVQVGTIVGFGLLTALVGAVEVNLIIRGGEYSVVGMGNVTDEILLTLAGCVLIAVALHYHVKAAFCLALFLCTIIWWSIHDLWPSTLLHLPHLHNYSSAADNGGIGDSSSREVKIWADITDIFANSASLRSSFLLAGDLVFLYVLCLCGLVVTLSALGGLIRPDGTTPRNRWLYIICGVVSVISGCFSGPPVLLSPESTAGVKAGARTGLSSVVCGSLFGLSVFFGPTLKAIPYAATSPVLIIVGVILFQNVARLDWRVTKDAVPAFFIAFFVPFTYSVLQGVAVGYGMYVAVALGTGDLYTDGRALWKYYNEHSFLHEYSDSSHGSDRTDESRHGVHDTEESSLFPPQLHSPGHEEWSVGGDGVTSDIIGPLPDDVLPIYTTTGDGNKGALDEQYWSPSVDTDITTHDLTTHGAPIESSGQEFELPSTHTLHISNSTGTINELTPLREQRQQERYDIASMAVSPGIKHHSYSFTGGRSSRGSRGSRNTSVLSVRRISSTDMDGLDWSVHVQAGTMLNEEEEKDVHSQHALHNPTISPRYSIGWRK